MGYRTSGPFNFMERTRNLELIHENIWTQVSKSMVPIGY
jgi:hypothetical protein